MRSFKYLLLSLLSVVCLYAAETLHLQFGEAKTLNLPGGKLEVPQAQDGWLLRGSQGLAVPAPSLIKANEGTIIVRFKLNSKLDEKQKLRNIMTYRCRSRNRAAIYIGGNSKILRFYVGDYTDKVIFESPIPIEFGKEHSAAIAWGDGRVRFYLDGLMLEDAKLPLPLEKPDKIHLGPYKDGYGSMAPGKDDQLFNELLTYDEGLPSSKIAELSGASIENAVKGNPGLLSVPVNTAKAPEIDGKLDEPFWKQAASLPVLVNFYSKYDSFKAPNGYFLISADSQNLYLGMQYIFPSNNTISQGQPRTPESKPEVFGTESFEFFLFVNGEAYRFGGNVAGGSTERKGKDRDWTAPWQYKSKLAMLIDNSQVWQAEAAIPWSSLELKGMPQEPLPFNFCRSWTITDFSGATALNPDGSYWIKENSPKISFVNDAPTCRLIERNNPANGTLKQKMLLYSPVAGELSYEIAMLLEDGSCMPAPIYAKKINVKAGESKEVEVDVPLRSGEYDMLRYTLSRKGKVFARNLVPFKQDDIIMEVNPRFFQDAIDVALRTDKIQRNFGSQGDKYLRLADTAGKELWAGKLKGDKMTVPFDHEKLPAGNYKLQLADAAGKEFYAQELVFPGMGEWSKVKYDQTVILPPFTPLETKGSSFSMWGRTYGYARSILPNSVKTQGKELFAAAPAVIANGEAALQGTFQVKSSLPHRADFIASARHSAFTVQSTGFVEYDGVSYSKIQLKAQDDLKELKLRFTLNAAYAKYLHAANGSSWGTKTTCSIKPGKTSLGFYPMMWIGDEEQGICLFTESKKGWTGPKNQVWTIEKDGDKAVVEVRLKTSLEKGSTFEFEFGYVATPVKKHTSDFPLDIMGDNHTQMMRRPGRAPVNYLAIFSHFKGSVNPFNDFPTEETWTDIILNSEQMKWRKASGTKLTAYMASRGISDEYPEIKAYKNEWRVAPGFVLPYTQDGRKVTLFECCPCTAALDFYSYHLKRFVERTKVDSIYYDFGVFGPCSNVQHGCSEHWPILAMRELYRRTALILYESGVKEPLVVLHNTDCVEVPSFTFVTHLFNGEHIRQDSSTLYHNGKDILDSYDLTMFASELSSLPFGFTNSVYNPADTLKTEFGGGKEPAQLYSFRISQAFLAATLPHNTITAQNRTHFGILDKIVREYERFGVKDAEFIGYWKKPAAVQGADDILVSIYRHPGQKKALAVVSHVGKEHKDQDFTVVFDAKVLGFAPTIAKDLLTADDPDYQLLYKLLGRNHIYQGRAPLQLGDFGSKVNGFKDGKLSMSLKHHTFALVEISL
ncbi:MAG: hypothetical protein J5746_11420 [Victivallales bacterium]|nr:hypothetical protein [Victivallales bacterium]